MRINGCRSWRRGTKRSHRPASIDPKCNDDRHILSDTTGIRCHMCLLTPGASVGSQQIGAVRLMPVASQWTSNRVPVLLSSMATSTSTMRSFEDYVFNALLNKSSTVVRHVHLNHNGNRINGHREDKIDGQTTRNCHFIPESHRSAETSKELQDYEVSFLHKRLHHS